MISKFANVIQLEELRGVLMPTKVVHLCCQDSTGSHRSQNFHCREHESLIESFHFMNKIQISDTSNSTPWDPSRHRALSGQLQTDSCPSYTPQSLGRTHCKYCVLSLTRLPVPPQGRRFEWTKQPHSATALGFISRICMFIWEEPVPPSAASLRGLFTEHNFSGPKANLTQQVPSSLWVRETCPSILFLPLLQI